MKLGSLRKSLRLQYLFVSQRSFQTGLHLHLPELFDGKIQVFIRSFLLAFYKGLYNPPAVLFLFLSWPISKLLTDKEPRSYRIQCIGLD